MSKVEELISPEDLKELLHLDPYTGIVTWKKREFYWFESKRAMNIWNKRYAGKRALSSISKAGYFRGTILYKNVKTHRVVWALYYGYWPKHEIDHINGNGCDNCITNLRDVTRIENARNVHWRLDNKSGYMGVIYRKGQNKPYGVQIANISYGYYKTLEAAAKTAKRIYKKLGYSPTHGEQHV